MSIDTINPNAVTVTQPQVAALAQQNKPDPLADASPEWRQVIREAEKLAVATLTPGHLKVKIPPSDGTPETESVRRAAWQQTVANCILVANQAQKWGADVFAVAAESYVVQNKLGYQGKLIAAVVNARSKLTTALKAMYSTGTGDNFAAVIYGSKSVDFSTLAKEERDEIFALLEKYVDSSDQAANRQLARRDILTIRVSVGQCKTENKMWRNDPEQKLWYTGATKWARRHAPELMVGILSDDDLDRMRMEQRISQTAEQKRISSLIPSSLDTTALGVPNDHQEFTPQVESLPLTDDEKALPPNPPTAAEIVAADPTPGQVSKPPEQQTQSAAATNGADSSTSDFDPVAWANQWIANIPQCTRAKARREATDELIANMDRLGPQQYERCYKAAQAQSWILE